MRTHLQHYFHEVSALIHHIEEEHNLVVEKVVNRTTVHTECGLEISVTGIVKPIKRVVADS